MPQKIVVLGSGPGGYVAALRAAQLGADVTIIALWDGDTGDGAGGTRDMVDRAVLAGAKVVQLDPTTLL